MTANLTFVFVPAADSTVDAVYELRFFGVDTGISIQDTRAYSSGMYTVVEHGGTGKDYWAETIGRFSSLEAAKVIATDTFSKRNTPPTEQP